jgi:hypothetical protein
MASDCIVRPLQTRGCFGFGHRTAYLAIAYFDSFLLRRRVDVIYPRRRFKKKLLFFFFKKASAFGDQRANECLTPGLALV